MEKIKTNTQRMIHERIKDAVSMFDSQAEVYLFGPGTYNQGEWVDVYVNSNKLNRQTKELIRKKIKEEYMINIDLVCILHDEKSLANMKAIGMKI